MNTPKLEEKVENLENRLEEEIKDKQGKIEKIEALHEKLEDAEHEIKKFSRVDQETECEDTAVRVQTS